MNGPGPLLFVGLGNPGPSYANHRHNIGFMAVESIAWRHRFPTWRQKFKGEITEGQLGPSRVLLLKPMTFMNLSGQSVGEAMRFFKIPLADIVVFHDELDLVPGKVRIKMGGGVAGHNGLKSLAAHLGTQDFKRVRLGIGHPGHKDRVIGHVLSDFHKSDTDWLEPLLDGLAEAAPLLAANDDADFMNRVALVTQAAAKPD